MPVCTSGGKVCGTYDNEVFVVWSTVDRVNISINTNETKFMTFHK